MKAVLLAPFVLAATMALAQARVGEEMNQLVSRYGQPLPKPDQKPPPGQIGTTETFQKNGFQIEVTLLDGISAQESFKKLNGDAFTSEEIETLLADNAQGHAWQAPQKSGGQTHWLRDDGSSATLTGGHVLKITSSRLLDTQTRDKQLEKTPSLEGF